jgi:hypothetical protein
MHAHWLQGHEHMKKSINVQIHRLEHMHACTLRPRATSFSSRIQIWWYSAIRHTPEAMMNIVVYCKNMVKQSAIP